MGNSEPVILTETGVWVSKCDLYIFVAFPVRCAFMFSSKHLKHIIKTTKPMEVSSSTSHGYLVPVSSLTSIRTAKLTNAMMKHCPVYDGMACSTFKQRGDLAEKVARMILKPDRMSSKHENKYLGIDFWHAGKRIQVKHDRKASTNANLYVEISECHAED